MEQDSMIQENLSLKKFWLVRSQQKPNGSGLSGCLLCTASIDFCGYVFVFCLSFATDCSCYLIL